MSPGVEGDLVIVMQACYRDYPLSRPEMGNADKTLTKQHNIKSFMVRVTLCTLSSPRVVTPGSATRRHRPDVHTGAPVVRDSISSSGKTRRGRGAVTIEL